MTTLRHFGIPSFWHWLLGFQHLGDMLFAMVDSDLDAAFPMEVFSQMLCGIDTAMLTASATKGEHEMSESAFHETLHMEVGQTIDALQQ